MSASPDKRVKSLQRKVNSLSKDIQAIIQEHDTYVLSKDGEAEKFFSFDLPIETLNDSLLRARGGPRSKYSLKDFYHKIALRRLAEKTKEELDDAERNLRLAKIEVLLDRAKKELSEV